MNEYTVANARKIYCEIADIKIRVELCNCSGNIFAVLGRVKKDMQNYRRRVDPSYEDENIFKKLDEDIKTNANNYYEALRIISKYVDLTIL
jgi:hypothetical protein